jgi:transposase
MVEEPDITISCGRCGYITRIGTAITFRCSRSSCNFITDLNFNGARNVLLRYLSRRGPSPLPPPIDTHEWVHQGGYGH